MKDKMHIIMGSIIVVLLLLLVFKPTTGRFVFHNEYFLILDTSNGDVWHFDNTGKRLVKFKK